MKLAIAAKHVFTKSIHWPTVLVSLVMVAGLGLIFLASVEKLRRVNDACAKTVERIVEHGRR